MKRQKMLRLGLGAAIGIVLAVASGSAAAPPSQPVSVNRWVQVSSLNSQVDITVFTIPVGKRLVIEYVSAKVTVPSGQTVSAIHLNMPIVHFFVVVAQGTELTGDNVFAAAQSLRTTIGPVFGAEMDVVVRAERNAFGTLAIVDVTLAGQLID